MTVELLEREPADSFLPCPFCGGEADLRNSPAPSYWVECDDCRARAPEVRVAPSFGVVTQQHHRKAKADAITGWNRRAQPSAH